MSPRTRPSRCIFSYLARGLRTPLSSAAIRLPPLPSYSSVSTRHASSPERQRTKETRDRAFTLCDMQGVNGYTHQQTVRVQALMLDESCLLCTNFQMCTHSSQVRILFEHCSPSLPVCVSAVEVWDANYVPCLQKNVTCFSCLAAKAWSQIPFKHWITSSRSCTPEEDESRCFPSNSATT